MHIHGYVNEMYYGKLWPVLHVECIVCCGVSLGLYMYNTFSCTFDTACVGSHHTHESCQCTEFVTVRSLCVGRHLKLHVGNNFKKFR